jgi:hypothetical protein
MQDTPRNDERDNKLQPLSVYTDERIDPVETAVQVKLLRGVAYSNKVRQYYS